MILTTRLKIWTLISHACIVIGLGHGILTLGIAEFFWLSTLFDNRHYVGEDGDVLHSTLQMVAIMCLVGQIATVISIYLRQATVERWVHISGLCVLWASVFIYAYGIRNDNYAHLAVLSCLPFAYCTIRTFLGGYIQLVWKKIEAGI